MRSPFPGMDPYLEAPSLWRDVHSSFLVEVRVALNAILPPGFAARTEERLYIVEPDRAIYPDIALVQRGDPPSETSKAAVIDPPQVYLAPPEEVHELFVEVRSPAGKTVTVIELLSLSNKMAGRGREEYRRKQHDLLRSEIHLLEIDLLRAGEHTLMVPKRKEKDYLVCLHRGDGNWRFETWEFGVRDPLPRVAVPLTPEHPDVALDLRAVLEAVYLGGRYGQFIDYSQPATPPLPDDLVTWAEGLSR